MAEHPSDDIIAPSAHRASLHERKNPADLAVFSDEFGWSAQHIFGSLMRDDKGFVGGGEGEEC